MVKDKHVASAGKICDNASATTLVALGLYLIM